MIPEDRMAAVQRGLREAFDVAAFEDIRVQTGGRSGAQVYRIVVRGAPFLLRLITRTSDPTLPVHFTCMKTAAEARLAPRVWYTSIEDKLSITDFVETAPLPIADALVRMPTVLRGLHALPPFPGRENHLNTSCMFLMHRGPAVDGLMSRIGAGKILRESELAELFSKHEQMVAVHSHDNSDMVSSHNDLFKPDNILFDGRRVWLVDWKAAFLNDRYADLAVVANMVVSNTAEEDVYLESYFGQAPDEYQRARFFLMRQLAHLFYTMAFLLLVPAKHAVDLSEQLPEFHEYQRRIWAREVDLADTGAKTIYGRLHWEQLLENTRQPRFGEALRIVADRPA